MTSPAPVGFDPAVVSPDPTERSARQSRPRAAEQTYAASTDIVDAARQEPSSLALEVTLIFLVVAASFVNLAVTLMG